MRGTVVGVLRGGPSREHEVSLQTGHAILNNLDQERFTPRDIYIDKKGVWHVHGKETSPSRALHSVDVVMIGLHGEYGEDGEVQKVLERHGVAYVGSDPFASFLAMHKVLTKERAKEHGVLTPRYQFVESLADRDAVIAEVIRSFPQPVVVKPVKWGSSVGISMVSGYAPIYRAVTSLLEEGSGGVLIEELIKGTEASVTVVERMRGEDLYTPPPVEIIPPEDDFFSYDAKYTGVTEEICPGRFSPEIAAELEHAARTMHQALGLRHYSRSDFIVSPKGVYFLESNTLPGFTAESLAPKSLAAVGVSFPQFVSHLIDLAHTKA